MAIKILKTCIDFRKCKNWYIDPPTVFFSWELQLYITMREENGKETYKELVQTKCKELV